MYWAIKKQTKNNSESIRAGQICCAYVWGPGGTDYSWVILGPAMPSFWVERLSAFAQPVSPVKILKHLQAVGGCEIEEPEADAWHWEGHVILVSGPAPWTMGGLQAAPEGPHNVRGTAVGSRQ